MGDVGQQLVTWLNENPGAAAVIGALLLAIITALFAFGRNLLSLMASTFNLFASRMHVREITSQQDKHFSAFIDAYHELFSEDDRTATSEIIDWLEGKGNPCGIDYSLFLVRARRENVGIAIPMVKKAEGLVFIAYLGLTQEAARWRASEKIVREILRKIERKVNWNFLVIELDHPSLCEVGSDEHRTRAARILHFEALSKQTEFPLYFADFEYMRPIYHTDAVERDAEPMVLGIIRRDKKLSHFKRQDILSILSFVYRDIYGGCLWTGHAKYDVVHRQIEELMSDFEKRFNILVELPRKFLETGEAHDTKRIPTTSSASAD